MTEKQLRWQKRNRILWRLKGMVGFPFEEGVLTPLENDFVKRGVKAHNSTVDELRSLGKLSPQDDIKYSIEYKDSIVPLQESIGEDATTATYKKTYKFIGIW